MLRPTTLALLALNSSAMAEIHHHDAHCKHDHANETQTGVRLTPYLSTAMALGGSTGDSHFLEESGHHDPRYDGFNMQAMELGGSLLVGEAFSATAIYNEQWDRNERWDGHWEEAYMNFRILPQLSIKSGIYLADLGSENAQHVHARSFVESSLANTRFLGEDGLIMRGVALTYTWGDDEQHALQFGVGSAETHEHEEEEHDEEPLIHAHEGIASREMFHARLTSELAGFTGGLSAMRGENAFGRETWLASADVARDFTLAGKSATWAAEVSYRHVDAFEEESGEKASFDETAVSLALHWALRDDLSSHSRIEWISGNDDTELVERTRLSTNLSYQHELLTQIDSTTRLQYNADLLPGSEVEHSVWLQVILEFGEGH